VTIKQIFSLIGGGFVALLFAILGIQRKTIKKQKAKVKEAEEEVKAAEAKAEQAVQTVEIIKDARKVEQAIQTQETTNEAKIEEAKDDKEVLDFASNLIDNWNNGM
jgi:outer membrane phospholipase A